MVGAIVGLLLGVVAVMLVEQHDDRASTPSEAEEALGMEVLTSVPALPRTPDTNGSPVVPEDNPETQPLEAFRRLRSEIVSRLQGISGSKILAVVGPGTGEGKSTIAANLARTLGLEGRRVLLFDADFRNPRLKQVFSLPKRPGLEEYLRSAVTLDTVVHPSGHPGVDVLGASHSLSESPELPARARFRQLWSEFRAYDYVVVDAGAVNAHSEVAVVASQADAAILVMDERATELGQVVSARRILDNHQVKILGLVVNRTRIPSAAAPAAGLFRSNGRKNRGHSGADSNGRKPVAAAGTSRFP
jgi:capsular exopolysaccharide synthesis family protein